MKIARCDDEIIICSQIEKILTEIFLHKSIDADIDLFYSGERLCEEMEKEKYDLIFLDIEFPNMNGVETGKYIRKVLNNNITQIAYISSKQEYAMELFKVHPLDFLKKPLDKEQLEELIDDYITISGAQKEVFRYKKGYSSHKIEVQKIMYFVRDNRKVSMYTTEGVETFYESLESIYDRIKNYGFLFIHKSYMVNYRYIQVIKYDSVIMSDNAEFSISQSRRKQIREIYNGLEEK